jgi:hypothetical protein
LRAHAHDNAAGRAVRVEPGRGVAQGDSLERRLALLALGRLSDGHLRAYSCIGGQGAENGDHLGEGLGVHSVGLGSLRIPGSKLDGSVRSFCASARTLLSVRSGTHAA